MSRTNWTAFGHRAAINNDAAQAVPVIGALGGAGSGKTMEKLTSSELGFGYSNLEISSLT
jgi:hypothetical protein